MTETQSIDLHERTVPEAIREFVRFYNDCVKGGYRGRIEVIHGYGSTGSGGVIRKKLREYLAAHAEKLGSLLPGDSLGNPGVTILYAKKLLPASVAGGGAMPLLNAAQEASRKYCETPKARERILIKFRGRFGDRVLSAEIRNMLTSGALEEMRATDGKLQYKAGTTSEPARAKGKPAR
jgi:hypothetical protein